MAIDIDDFDVDPYDVYMDELTASQRNKVLGPKEKKSDWWWWKAFWWILLWFAALPYSLVVWPVYPAVRKVIRHIRKHRV